MTIFVTIFSVLPEVSFQNVFSKAQILSYDVDLLVLSLSKQHFENNWFKYLTCIFEHGPNLCDKSLSLQSPAVDGLHSKYSLLTTQNIDYAYIT